MVVEIVSPGDESLLKFDFFARHGVDEVLVADPATRQIRLWLRSDSAGEPGYDETDRSDLLDVTAVALAAEIAWPSSPSTRAATGRDQPGRNR